MEFDDWEPFYESILGEFGYDREEDRKSARLLDEMLEDADYEEPLGELEDLLRDEVVAVVGDAPSLEPTDVCAPVVASADGAAKRLSEAGVESDVVVTDLDGAPEHAAEASRDGTIAVVHAHGDNPDAVGHWTREFDRQNVLGTTQTDPRLFGTLYNFGGFTDGDRTVFLADALGAKEIRLFGFDFEEADGKKRKKLRWAHTLLEHIEKKRGESLL